MTVDLRDPREMTGATVLGGDGQKLGKVDNVYFDNNSGRPEWASIKTGLFGGHVSLVPLANAEYRDGQLQVPYRKDDVQRAPHHEPDQELSVDDERELFSHYGLDYGGDTATARSDDTATGGNRHGTADAADADRGGRSGAEGAVGHDTSGPTTDQAMTRSEEELHVGTEARERGRARLRKYVVTENVTQTVPVSHEEVRLEREPITEQNADAAHDGPEISEEEHEVVLHEERPVVGKETVAKERVRLGTETQRSEEQVSEQVRKEEIETDGTEGVADGDARTRSGSESERSEAWR
jgi:uncharacterized protein (TIGR02271 family)